ncbi:uncharacterized protein [Haliotis asinina]|uniref:uncharacterized protein isoform X2 n=1 Tax=Haliotis asinina TaxID=109174 RepID=UPI0035326D18
MIVSVSSRIITVSMNVFTQKNSQNSLCFIRTSVTTTFIIRVSHILIYHVPITCHAENLGLILGLGQVGENGIEYPHVLTRSGFKYPREIKYKCLVGLMIMNRVTYHYQLKLTSLPSQAETKYTLVIHSEPREHPKCRVVLAVAAIAARRSVHVVWERPDSTSRITQYLVSLYQKKDLLSTAKKKYGTEEHEFENLSPGYYIVKVEPKMANNTSPCGKTVYKNIQLIYIDPPLKEEDSTLKILLAAISGAVLAVILLIVICWHGPGCFRSAHVSGSGQTLLVSAGDVQGRVKKLSCVLRQNLHVDVHYDQEQLQQITAGTGLAKWFEDKAKNSNILVVCSKLGKEISEKKQRENYYHQAVEQIGQNPSLSCRVYFVCFDKHHEHMEVFSNNNNLNEVRMKPSCFSHSSRNHVVYVLPDDFSNLGRKLKKGGMDKNYKLSESWKDFCKEMVNRQPSRINFTRNRATSSIVESDAISRMTNETLMRYPQAQSMGSMSDQLDDEIVEEETDEEPCQLASTSRILLDEKNWTNLLTLKEPDLDKSCVSLEVVSDKPCHGQSEFEFTHSPDLPSNYAPDSGFVSSPMHSVDPVHTEKKYRQDEFHPLQAQNGMGDGRQRILNVGYCNVNQPNLHPDQCGTGMGKCDCSLSGQGYNPYLHYGHQTFIDSGHYDCSGQYDDSGHYDDSGQYEDSMDHNYSARRVDPRGQMFPRHLFKGPVIFDEQGPPGRYVPPNQLLQLLPTELQSDWPGVHPDKHETPFIPSQTLYHYQDNNSLFQDQRPKRKQFVNNPQFQRQPDPHPWDEDLQEGVPLLNPSSDVCDTGLPQEVKERLSSGSEWDAPNIDFCPPDVFGGSDDRSLTFCMEQDESGQFVIVPQYHGMLPGNNQNCAPDSSEDSVLHVEVKSSSNPELKVDGDQSQVSDEGRNLHDQSLEEQRRQSR